jgi:hypothetical protein
LSPGRECGGENVDQAQVRWRMMRVRSMMVEAEPSANYVFFRSSVAVAASVVRERRRGPDQGTLHSSKQRQYARFLDPVNMPDGRVIDISAGC